MSEAGQVSFITVANFSYWFSVPLCYMQILICTGHCVSEKWVPFCFLNNSVKYEPILTTWFAESWRIVTYVIMSLPTSFENSLQCLVKCRPFSSVRSYIVSLKWMVWKIAVGYSYDNNWTSCRHNIMRTVKCNHPLLWHTLPYSMLCWHSAHVTSQPSFVKDLKLNNFVSVW